jgi:hypothetical protein
VSHKTITAPKEVSLQKSFLKLTERFFGGLGMSFGKSKTQSITRGIQYASQYITENNDVISSLDKSEVCKYSSTIDHIEYKCQLKKQFYIG